MRNERKYVVLSIMSFVLVALLLVTCSREYWRMDAASDRQTHEYVTLGATLYAENCMQCHGPAGEGVVGLPLNRADLQGDPRDARFADVYRMIYNTLRDGRLGRTTTHWVPVGDTWLSYSQMPPWGRESGGPMDEHMLKGLTYFIMLGTNRVNPDDPNSRTFWQTIGSQPFTGQQPNTEAELPVVTLAEDPAENERLNEQVQSMLIKDLACVACHNIGGRGAFIGPDLSTVGAWVDPEHRDRWEAFLKSWVYDAPSVPAERRMPSYWYANRTGTPEPVLENPIQADPVLNKTYMPSFKRQFDEKLGEENLDLLVRYLMKLGVEE